jgi:DNA-directed RNA polymerase subunit RPC12/RpoP
MRKIDFFMDCEELQECLDCGYVGTEYGEIEQDDDEAEVVCPQCSSYHFYLKV